MGRGQSITDSFAPVFGEIRGIRADQEALSSAPTDEALAKVIPFSPQAAVAKRRMALVLWLQEHDTGRPRSVWEIKRGLGREGPSCNADVQALMRQGVIGEGQVTRKHRIMEYGVLPAEAWTPEHQKAFLSFCKAN